MTHLAILTVRNEAAFLLEWLAHHRAIGFDRFLIFSNDCDDGTDQMLDRLQDMGLVTHLPNPGPYDQRGIQFTALQQAARHPLVKEADWILPLDLDEFVNIQCGDHSLSALHAALPEATAITLTWRLFGSGGKVRFEDRPVTDTFIHCAPRILHWPWRASMFKTLYRNDGTYRKPGVHRPRQPDPNRLDQARWFDGHGRELEREVKERRIFSPFGRDNYGLVQLNHYPLGAMESYLLKVARGRAVHADQPLGMDYWVERNFNVEEDSSIAQSGPARQAELDQLRSDETLDQLHQKAVDWRRAQFDRLMSEEPFRALMGRLMMTPATSPIPPKAARFLVDYALRAHQTDAE